VSIMAESFTLDNWPQPAPIVHLPNGLSKEDLLGFRAFNNWTYTLKNSLAKQKNSFHKFHEAPYSVRSIEVQSFDRFGSRILFMKLFATIKNENNEFLPGVVFLRGGSVAILMILRPSDSPEERWVIMTEQARIAAGSLEFMEIPAGMLDDEKNFQGAAVKEIEEEVGIKLKVGDLTDMTALAMKGHRVMEGLHSAMYPSPGACDEFISIFLWERKMDRLEIERMKDRMTGNRAESEKITVRLMNYERLLEVGARDGKTLAAWSLYEYLKRTRLIE